MTVFLVELLVRTSLLAGATGLILFVFRIRTAASRHTAWAAVLMVMLVLPASLAAGLRMSVPLLNLAVTNVESDVSRTAVVPPATPTSVSFSQFTPRDPASQAMTSIDWELYLAGVYLAGALVLLVRLAVGTIQANRLRRTAAIRRGRLTSDCCATPITVGWFRPSLILPHGWDHWSSTQLGAVLTHEQEHARRHDPLVQWFALLNRAVFWFHPLSWWLERRLATLAEEACDAAVLVAGYSPQQYSEYLIDMARAVARQRGRIRLIGMAMPGAGLPDRLRVILLDLRGARLSRTRIGAAMALCTALSVVFGTATLAERRSTQDPVSPTLQIKFEAVIIRPCEDSGPSNGRGGGGMRNALTPGYASWGCVSLAELIDQAYGGGPFPKNSLLNTVRLAPGENPDALKRVRGGPAWIEKDKFAIEIRLSGDTTDLTGPARHDLVLTDMGPAFRAMLEDRFQLKLRKATEEAPMYALTVASGGLKITAVDPNRCYEVTAEQRAAAGRVMLPPPPAGFEGTLPCGYNGYRASSVRAKPGNLGMQFVRVSMKDFALSLSRSMDRYVLDKTGIDGRFNFTIEYALDDTTPGDRSVRDMFREARRDVRPESIQPEPVKSDGPTIFKALEELGLSLQKTKGPAEYLLIESAQRPVVR